MTVEGGPPAGLPDGFVVRPPRPDEAEPVAELIRACDVADTGEPDWSLDDTHADWARLGFDLARDARVVVAPGGRVVSYTDVHARPDRAPVAFDEWRRYIVERKDFDRTLSFVAMRGGEVAGAAMCLIFEEMKEGWVRQLAVGEKHRGLGLGRALLLNAFGEFYHRGMQRVGLGVHADNPSATKLYLGVGMYAQQKYIQYHRPAT